MIETWNTGDIKAPDGGAGWTRRRGNRWVLWFRSPRGSVSLSAMMGRRFVHFHFRAEIDYCTPLWWSEEVASAVDPVFEMLEANKSRFTRRTEIVRGTGMAGVYVPSELGRFAVRRLATAARELGQRLAEMEDAGVGCADQT